MEVRIVSKENVKPSSPTPPHLRSFKLSLLDQLIPSSYAPIVFFYPKKDNTSHLDISERLDLLKSSLSETLTRFYPLAGQVKDELFIECNDEGANFIETRVNCCLNGFLNQPELLLVNQFLPCELVTKESIAGTCVTNIQANVFECDGIAIGICISHRILDGSALASFLKAWTESARGCGDPITPDFVASSLFPANDLWLRDSSVLMWRLFFKMGRSITRRFVFDGSSIDTLKAQATSTGLKCPTRVETVSAFLWKCTMLASEELHGHARPSLLTHIVNLRKRFAPPLSDHSIGNLIWMVATKTTAKSKPEMSELVGIVKEAIARIDSNYVKEMRGDEGRSLMSKTFEEVGGEGSEAVDYLSFSSWCNMGFYGVDFGWGKPIWVSSIGVESPMVLNLVMLVDTKLGDGIEAWVTLDQQEMTSLENNPELLKFASLDPSPLLKTCKPCFCDHKQPCKV